MTCVCSLYGISDLFIVLSVPFVRGADYNVSIIFDRFVVATGLVTTFRVFLSCSLATSCCEMSLFGTCAQIYCYVIASSQEVCVGITERHPYH